MNWVKPKVITDGGRNVSVQVTGELESPETGVILLDTRAHLRAHSPLKLASLVWLIQEKMTVVLRWGSDSPEDLILPMESRNYVRFDHGIRCPDGWSGLITADFLNVQRDPLDLVKKTFFLIFDMDKG